MYNNHGLFGSCDSRDQNGPVRDLSSSHFLNPHLSLYNIPQYPMANPTYHFHNQSPRVLGGDAQVPGKVGQKRLKETDAIQYLNQVYFVSFKFIPSVHAKKM